MAQSEAGETQSTKAKSATVLGQTLVRRETMSRAHVRESVSAPGLETLRAD
jgi:hypothetical protein